MVSLDLTVLLVILLSFNVVHSAKILDANKFTQELRKLADGTLGVNTMQEHFSSLDFENYNLKGEELIERLEQSLKDRFGASVRTVKNLQEAVRSSLSESSEELTECCTISVDDLNYVKRFGKYIDEDNACVRLSPSFTDRKQIPSSVVDVMKSNYRQNSHIKWQYFGAETGVFSIYPASGRASCDDYDSRYRPWYVESATSEPKNVVLVVDKSQSMNLEYQGRTLLAIAKEAANTVIDTMNPSDKVNVVSFSNDVTKPTGCEDTCYEEQLALATPQNKKCLTDFVNSIRDRGDTHYKKALTAAFDLLNATQSSSDGIKREQVILFLTDGQPSDAVTGSPSDPSLARNRDIMLTIKERNAQMNNEVVILTFGLGSKVEGTLLTRMAEQDGTVYGVDKDPNAELKVGRYTPVLDPNNLRQNMASYYNYFSDVSDNPIFSVPYQAASGIGLVTTVALPVLQGSTLKGVVGVDISLQDLFADITYFREGQSTYSFIYEINRKSNGRTLSHPLLPAPNTIEQDPAFVHITSLERESQFLSLIYEPSKGSDVMGSASFPSTRTIPRGNSATEGVRTLVADSTFYWRKVAETPYVVCLVMADNDNQSRLTHQSPTGNDFVYHRLDLTPGVGQCRHFTRLAGKDYSSVKFAPESFEDPVGYLLDEEDTNKIEQYTKYMNGETEATVYFKDGVRDMVVATANVHQVWLSESREEGDDVTDVSQYTAFLYIGAENGVFRIYPAVQMNTSYDHMVRPWYERAKSNKGDITLSAPYRAASGAGYVITMSHTIIESTKGTSSGTSDEVIAVMGMDFTLSYFSFLLKRLYSQCDERRYSCFVMDSSGYLIYHDSFFTVDNGEINIDKPHITEVEELRSIAEHLIEEGVLVKTKCVDFQKINLQNYYQVYNLPNGIDNMADGDRCKQYQMERIGATNAYLGIIDQSDTCHQPAVCPCSQKCQKADIAEKCECPCESPAEYKYCDDKYEFTSDDSPSCTPPIVDPAPIINERKDLQNLPQCFKTKCSSLKDALDCNAAVSCEWCRDGLYEDVSVKTPYCGDIIHACQSAAARSVSSGAIVGAVLAVITVIVIVIVVIIVVLRVRRKRGKSVPKEVPHIPVSYSLSAAPSAPPPPSAPSAAPVHMDFGYDLRERAGDNDGPSYLTASGRSYHDYETPMDFQSPDYSQYPHP
ncbi:VWFA and cache domain-containing protein 1-like [Glandiceps talaboti]